MTSLDPASIFTAVPPDQQQTAQAVTAKEQRGVRKRPRKRFFASVGKGIRRRRVPVMLQMGAVECGAACLAMILAYYGRKISISELREQCGIGRDGLSAFGLVKAARAYGLRTRAITLAS